MTSEVSIYLDAIRFTAAMVVFLGHVSGQRLTGGLLWQVGRYMDDAVIVFFVLSGFVIAHVASERELKLTEYAVSRTARIYSVALPALIATFILDQAGQSINPALYDSSWGYVYTGKIEQFLAGLSFTNELWFRHVDAGSDLPYWSLGYEVWYYVAFGLAWYLPARYRWWGAAVAILCAGPKIAALLPIWLLGVAAYRWRPVMRVALCWCLFCLPPVVALVWFSRHAPMGIVGIDGRRYLVGLLVTTHLLGFRAVSGNFAPLLAAIRVPVRWLAGATFTIYLFHLPVAQFLAAVMPGEPSGWAKRTTLTAGVLWIMFIIASETERRKDAWRRAIYSAFVRSRERLHG